MYKSIRKKVASTFSEIERTEDFAWGKWLKEPSVKEHQVEDFETSFLDTSQYNDPLVKPSFQKKTFGFKDTFVFPELKNIRPAKLKTHAVFFGLPKSELKKFKLFDKEFKFDLKLENIEFRDFAIKVKEVNWNFGKINVELIPWELKPIILKINLLDTENLSPEKSSGKEIKIDFKLLKTPNKIYRVKITSLDKSKLTKIYYLKNISLHDVRILRESLSRFSSPAVFMETLKYFIPEEETKPEDILKETEETKDNLSEQELNPEFFNEVSKTVEQQITESLNIDELEDVVIDEPTGFDEPEEKINKTVVDDNIPADNDLKTNDRQEENKLKSFKETSAEKEDTVKKKELAEAGLNDNAVTEEPEEVEEPDEEGTKDNTVFDSVYYFQQEGAEFLLDSKRAVLHDEPGLGKTVQVIAALKNLFKNKNISKAVIVCDSEEIGSWGSIPGETDGWLGHIHQRAPELKVEAAGKTTQSRNKQWKNPPDVFVLSYDAFLFDLDGNKINPKDLKKACFIFDEVNNLLEHKNFDRQKSRSFNPKYLWVASNFPEADLKEMLDNAFKEKLAIKHYLGRTKKNVENDLPQVTWQNKWITLDDDQVKEYNETFTTAKEKVQWFLESGNPLRFNANVFTLIHQIKQVCNFSEKGKSKKIKLLLDQVKAIGKNGQQVAIFSQYEKAGTKRIEEALKKNNINYLSYAPGLSTKEMSTVLKKFGSSPAVTALVVGVKPSKIKLPSGISYVIHFDLWWNPSTLWQTEDAVFGSLKENEKRNLNVYSYLTKSTIEERIHTLLYQKGFLNKNVMETVNPDSITEMITNPEWLEIFDMPDEEYKQRFMKGLLETENRIDKYSASEFAEKGKNFFTKLGYKNLDSNESSTGDSFDIRGILKKVKYDQQMCARFLLKDAVSEDEVKTHLAELKEITHNGKYFLITKGIFEGEEIIKTNDALIDKNLLANYFYQFIII